MKFYTAYVPKKSIPKLQLWIDELDVIVKIVKPRKTKLGDFKVYQGKMFISINNNLNPYSFLITLTHELAHAFVYNKLKEIRSPHGEQWRLMFRSMLITFLTPDYFPSDILKVLSLHIRKPKASTLSDIKLYSVLRNHDTYKTIMIEDIREGEEFSLTNGKLFVRGPKLRKRYRCIEKYSERVYMFHPFADVIRRQKKIF